MSSVIEEILTSTIGFVIAMVILSVVIGVGLYGYWVYANHVTLENYLWPIAEVLPYKGEYFLAIVNTGHEPFTIEQIYLKGGSVITPSQAVNPNLNWCSVSNTELMHNQWWCGMVNQLPVAVRVCSTLDPSVCVIAPVHGWTTVTFSQPSQAAFGVGNGLIEVVVNDPLNASWSVTWSYSGQSYSLSKSTSYTWFINPPYVPIQITFSASITQNPTGYKCQISPSSVTNTYSAGSVQQFTVNCELLPITVYVYDLYPEPAGWEISWSGAASGSESGYGMASFTVQPTQNGTVYFNATITSVPSGYSSCTITPTNTTALPGQSVEFVINCYGGPIYMNLVVQSNTPFSVGVYPWQGYPVTWNPVFSANGQESTCGWWQCWTLNSNVTLIPGQMYSIGVQPDYSYFSGAPPGSHVQCSINGVPYPVGAWTPFTAPNVSFVESVTVFCTVNTPSPPIGGGGGGGNYPGNCAVQLSPAYVTITSPGINTVTFTASLTGQCPSNGYWTWTGGTSKYYAQYNFMVNGTLYYVYASGPIVTNLHCQGGSSGIGFGSSITESYTLTCT
jgi:hypothetical protein